MTPSILKPLYSNVEKLKGFGPHYSSLLNKLCGNRFLDILLHKPSSIIKRVKITDLKDEYIFSITIPAKFQSYLACGKPILAMVSGEAAKIIEEAESTSRK